MIHEFKTIVAASLKAKEKNLKTAFVSVVDLEGSSYRRPGVRMLVREDHLMIGAVSGGCVEQEILRQSQGVLENGNPILMTYDGRYRLGCEGVLSILIEPFNPAPGFYTTFNRYIKQRKPFHSITYFSKEDHMRSMGGTILVFSQEEKIPVHADFPSNSIIQNTAMTIFRQDIPPGFRLFIVGAEHDAVQLCTYAALTGWEVTIIAPPDDPKTIAHFPGAAHFLTISEDEFDTLLLDAQTAVVIMTHSFVKDLKYSASLRKKALIYLGILGPAKRRKKLMSQLLEYYPDTPDSFFDTLHGPTGINIGAETPQEIAISILAEILSVVRQQTPIPLKDKRGTIHQQ